VFFFYRSCLARAGGWNEGVEMALGYLTHPKKKNNLIRGFCKWELSDKFVKD
jgi:hypothetical protein